LNILFEPSAPKRTRETRRQCLVKTHGENLYVTCDTLLCRLEITFEDVEVSWNSTLVSFEETVGTMHNPSQSTNSEPGT